MAKTYVKNRENSGIFFVYTQNIGVRRHVPVEVEKDALVVHALSQGAIVEVTKEEHDKFHAERNKKLGAEAVKKIAEKKEATALTAKFEKPTADNTNPTDDDLKATFDAAVKADIFTSKDDKFYFNKTKLGSEADALEEMKDDNGLYQEVLAAIAK
jgi:hypothetical protein